MCGIAGFLSQDVKQEKREESVRQINAYQTRRGPDDVGVQSSGDATFGHRRLSIIDLSPAGHQPMSYNNGRFLITFNGEIYNFSELKKELIQKGYHFTTNTDTEIILALFQEYNETSFQKMRGIFAFALWDAREEVLYLVRDHYGVKPIYYYCDEKKIIFASTVKGIERSGIVTSKKNNDAWIGFLLFGSVFSPDTTNTRIHSLPAGHYLVKGKYEKEKIIKYYNPLNTFLQRSDVQFHDAVYEVKNKLTDAVRLNLVSDATLGVFLSGGLDSSVLSVLAAESRKTSIITLSVYFEEKEFSERKYQRMVAEKIKSDHREILVTKKDFESELENIFLVMDQPTVDGVNTYFISKAAHDAGLKVVLSGLGSDEIFCGYANFRRACLLRMIQNMPYLIKLPLSLASFFSNRYQKIKRLQYLRIIDFYLTLRGVFMPHEVARILKISQDEVEQYLTRLENTLFINNYDQLKTLHPVNLLSYLELTLYMQNQLLKDADVMSMAHSIEARVPFLDFPLVEYMSGLSPHIKMNNRINKPLLVDAVYGMLPSEIFTRPKMGFIFPFQKWLKDKENFSDHWIHYLAKKILNYNES